MPAELVPWAVGDTGTSLTCSIQGFIIIVFYLAFPFYYASFSVFACKSRVQCAYPLEIYIYVWVDLVSTHPDQILMLFQNIGSSFRRCFEE